MNGVNTIGHYVAHCEVCNHDFRCALGLAVEKEVRFEITMSDATVASVLDGSKDRADRLRSIAAEMHG